MSSMLQNLTSFMGRKRTKRNINDDNNIFRTTDRLKKKRQKDRCTHM